MEVSSRRLKKTASCLRPEKKSDYNYGMECWSNGIVEYWVSLLHHSNSDIRNDLLAGGFIMHGGKAIVKIFERAGVDCIISSPGTEWPPVWEAFAELREQGVDRPRYINCRHEAAAVAMASGYTKITGKPQAVLLHATAGPLNAAMFLRAAYQERVPMVICCGETSAFGEESRLPDPGNQWIHDLTDIGGPAELLRRCGQWGGVVASAAHPRPA